MTANLLDNEYSGIVLAVSEAQIKVFVMDGFIHSNILRCDRSKIMGGVKPGDKISLSLKKAGSKNKEEFEEILEMYDLKMSGLYKEGEGFIVHVKRTNGSYEYQVNWIINESSSYMCRGKSKERFSLSDEVSFSISEEINGSAKIIFLENLEKIVSED